MQSFVEKLCARPLRLSVPDAVHIRSGMAAIRFGTLQLKQRSGLLAASLFELQGAEAWRAGCLLAERRTRRSR